MKIRCTCGEVIPDQTDYLSFKARLIADRDWEDFVEASEAGREVDASYVRCCYQCTHCGRLYVEDASNNLRAFAPEGHQAQVLGSSQGADWPAPLVGTWSDKPVAGAPRGRLFCDAEGGASEQFDDWDQMERSYYALFERLHTLGRLRSAFLRKNGINLHTWLPGVKPAG